MTQDAPATEPLQVAFADGSTTGLTVFPSGGSSDPVVLCLPAMGVRAGYYELLGDALAEAGMNAVLADLRGTGRSSVRPGRRTSFGYAELLELELPAIIEATCRRFGVEQVIVLGHSLGGQLGLLLAATTTRVSRVVLVASGSAWYRRAPGARSIGRFLGLQLIAATTLVWGYLPDWFPFAGREARGVVLDWWIESMTGRYRVRRSTVDYERALAESTVPAMFVTFPGDRFVPAPAMGHLAAKLTKAPVTWHEVAPSAVGLTRTHHFRWVFRPQAVVQAAVTWARTGTTTTDPGDQ
jgi:predicted alpha/beta hydrolase